MRVMEGGKCTSTNQAKEIELTGAGKIFSLAENFLDRLDRVLTWCPSNVANPERLDLIR